MQPSANPFQSPDEQPQQGTGAVAAPPFRDQSTGLAVYGIFQILIGGFCGLMTLFMLLMPMVPHPGMPPGQAPNAVMMVPAASMYVIAAVVFISLGVGSMGARRWARTLTVVLSWIWLVFGTAAMATFMFVIPRMFASMPQNEQLPPGALVGLEIMTGGMMTCLYIILPVLFLVFYQRASVRATCEWRDPQVRWTDRCPMPVLAVSIVLASTTISMAPLTACGFPLPFFGVLLSGIQGAILLLVWISAAACLAWGTYRLKMAAWWGTLLLMIAGSASAVVTFSRVSMMEMYEKMGMPEAQLEMIRKTGMAESVSSMMYWLVVPSAAIMVGYLLYVRRYFVRSGS